MTVFWTSFAKGKLDDIFKHYKLKSGSVDVSKKLVDSIVDYTKGLEKHPHIGQREDFLSDRSQGFRYLVFKNYKIIYWINKPKNRIDVSHVFDTRQDPFKLREMK